MELNLLELYEEMPDFHNHNEASLWFHKQFPNNIQFKEIDTINGTKVYYYHIIKDRKTYEEYMQSLKEPLEHTIISNEPFNSYSTVEISEDGGVSMTE
ncbi:hypothetical protein [Halalkalibacter hemicellulosilyticus]|uniref:Uncharacterized protein n=1 Tax=Halalkalibacter hemicellulosilyticusJCM 9152 TaxID=1236971 RepID=W4QMH3_9BACI|nr:hypothetical protein [Halalkalibacter hemicellulosilyticus]GAE32529.1 hypothetical protein JCM9152_4066 [Halalkalibacter hemicellulosilyticusJCM 9152]